MSPGAYGTGGVSPLSPTHTHEPVVLLHPPRFLPDCADGAHLHGTGEPGAGESEADDDDHGHREPVDAGQRVWFAGQGLSAPIPRLGDREGGLLAVFQRDRRLRLSQGAPARRAQLRWPHAGAHRAGDGLPEAVLSLRNVVTGVPACVIKDRAIRQAGTPAATPTDACAPRTTTRSAGSGSTTPAGCTVVTPLRPAGARNARKISGPLPGLPPRRPARASISNP